MTKTKKLLWAALLLIIGIGIGLFLRTMVSPSINDLGTYFPDISGGEYAQERLANANESGRVFFDGAWATPGETPAFPHAVLVDCRKDEMECTVANAQASMWGDFYNDLGYYDIETWADEGNITAVGDDTCIRSVLTADIVAGTVTVAETWKDSAPTTECGEAPEPKDMTWELSGIEKSKLLEFFMDLKYNFYDFTNG